MEITFENIHEVVLETLNPPEEQLLFLNVLGSWYFKFLQSQEKKLLLHIPKHTIESIYYYHSYTCLFSLTYRLINKPEIKTFENTCLFNLFDYDFEEKRFPKNKVPYFEINKVEEEKIIWNKNIFTSKFRFIPIFIIDQIKSSDWDDIFTTFKLFKNIENKGIIKYPILINLKEDLCLSTNSSELRIKDNYILFKPIAWDSKKMGPEDAALLEESLRSYDFSHQITIKYPRHKDIHEWLLNIGEKCFNIIFNSRFHYQSIEKDEIYLLPNELRKNNPLIIDFAPQLNIIDTNHSLLLFEALNKFKLAWKNYEFNKYTTPFPKYWFLFINQSLAKDVWFDMFKADYPDVAEKPIISSIKKIIDLIHDLNWSKSFIERTINPVLLLPEINGIKRKKLEKPLQSFKNYIKSIDERIVFVEANKDNNYKEYDNLLVLDGFNIINLLNISSKTEDFKIIIPDFLYYSYQPWIKYHLLKYQFDALHNLKRELLDQNFNKNLDTFVELRSNTITCIKLEIAKYQEKYNIEEEKIDVEESIFESEDIVFNNEEESEISIVNNGKSNVPEIQIETTDGKFLKMKSNSKVLLQNEILLQCRASFLVSGDRFILLNEINSALDKDAIINKLSRMPETVINFQTKLGNTYFVYRTLKEQGLEYKSEKYFNEKYVIKEKDYSSELFILPKKKEHWKIICDFLGINSIDLNQAWISYYGRKNIEEIKGIYMHILNLIINMGNSNVIENEQLIENVALFLETKKAIFEEGEGANTLELAKAIVLAIINELYFYQVKEIKREFYE